MTIEHPEMISAGGWNLENGAEGDPANPSAKGTLLNALDYIGFDSYYTWHPQPLADIDSTPEHIKQIEALWDVTEDTNPLLQGHSSSDLLIGYNEPWNSWNLISPQQALDSWPTLMATGMRLATPSISGPTDGNDWLAQFMAGANASGYRVDVINVHYYSKDGDVNAFKNYLDNIHNLYHKPIVVTEWALADWTKPNTYDNRTYSPDQQAAFAKAGTEMLDDLPYVEKQFWYAATDGGGAYINSGLVNPDGSLTVVGQTFYDLLHPGTATTPPVIDSGQDTLVLKMSEDFYQTDAQFTVAVDGRQIGGAQTSHAHNALGQSESFTFSGNWTPGSHTVSVNLLNDGWDGYPWWANGDSPEGHDRNIYVNGATYDGQSVDMPPIFVNRSDTAGSFMVTDSSSSAPTPAPDQTTTPASSLDTLTVRVSADHLNGSDPNMVVSLDGKVLDDTNFVSTIHEYGQWQDFTYTGRFGAGQHDVGISMSQDGWDGTNWWINGSSPEGHDLNLYVDSVILNGRANGTDAFINLAGTTSHWSVG